MVVQGVVITADLSLLWHMPEGFCSLRNRRDWNLDFAESPETQQMFPSCIIV